MTSLVSPRPNAALFTCSACAGWHLANGYKASPFQVHRIANDGETLVCDGCGARRAIMREGESIPVAVGRWRDLPKGVHVKPEAVLA